MELSITVIIIAATSIISFMALNNDNLMNKGMVSFFYKWRSSCRLWAFIFQHVRIVLVWHWRRE
jgi:hypothetical protein